MKRWRIIWEQDLPENCSAMAMFYDGYYRIHLCKKYCETRNAFSLAHEIGHIYMGDFEKYNLTFINVDSIDPKTIQHLDNRVNSFAAELLMPYEIVLLNYKYGFEHLCKIFSVSDDAMLIRLKKLKLISEIEAAATKEPLFDFDENKI